MLRQSRFDTHEPHIIVKNHLLSPFERFLSADGKNENVLALHGDVVEGVVFDLGWNGSLARILHGLKLRVEN